MPPVDEGNVTPQDNTDAGNEPTNQEPTNTTLISDKPEGEPSDQKAPPKGDEKNEGGESDKPKEGEESKDDKEAKAPEKYEDFTLPEGFEIEAEVLNEFSTLAKELNLTQEQAQKLVDISAKSSAGSVAKQHAEYEKVREGWVNDLRADKEFGGDKFDETVERAKRALRTFGSPELIQFAEDSGYGDNNEFIKLLAKVDKATGDDTIIDGRPVAKQGKSAAEVLYPGHANGA